MWRVFAPVPLSVKVTRKFVQVKGDSMGFMGLRRGFDEAWIKRQSSHQRLFTRVIEPLQWRRSEELRPLRARRQVREHLQRVAEDGMPARMAILNVEYRIVAGLFDDLGQVEIEDRVVLPVEHHEPHRITPDLVHNLP